MWFLPMILSKGLMILNFLKVITWFLLILALYSQMFLSIDLISDCVYGKGSKKVPPFEKKWFRKILKFATNDLFLYKDWLFRQVGGVAMGNPLGPSFANFFLGHFERYEFFQNLDINLKLYVCYVDHIFTVFSENVPVDTFFNHINQQQPQIKFTVENREKFTLFSPRTIFWHLKTHK